MCCLKAKSPGPREGYGVGCGCEHAGRGTGLPTYPSGQRSHPSPFRSYPTWLLELQDLGGSAKAKLGWRCSPWREQKPSEQHAGGRELIESEGGAVWPPCYQRLHLRFYLNVLRPPLKFLTWGGGLGEASGTVALQDIALACPVSAPVRKWPLFSVWQDRRG